VPCRCWLLMLTTCLVTKAQPAVPTQQHCSKWHLQGAVLGAAKRTAMAVPAHNPWQPFDDVLFLVAGLTACIWPAHRRPAQIAKY
jgi:hypothetical protein